mmetsp:Transcript_32963/g.36907  ORF Transcript_32963/g.36907 Transcript_32963/m.36907 type:complete len:236 (+) Transcript_32963:63-770(+)
MVYDCKNDHLFIKAKQQQEQQEIPTTNVTLQSITTDQLTTVFDSSKIKMFLYKEEPNMARLNGPSLDLISTTTALFLRSIINKSIRLDKGSQQLANKDEGETYPNTKAFLITSTQLKRVILTSPSLGFLKETVVYFKIKDGSVPVSSLRGYIPSVKKKQTKNRVANQSSPNQSDPEKESSNKRRRKTDATVNTYNQDTPLLSSDHAPLEKAIANAVNAKSHNILETIVADEDDYD